MECRIGSSLAISSHSLLATAERLDHCGCHIAHCRSDNLAFSWRPTQRCAGLSRKQLLGFPAVVAWQAAHSAGY